MINECAQCHEVECRCLVGGHLPVRKSEAYATRRKDDLKNAFVAGFMAAGEGWNGEWPFGSPSIKGDDRAGYIDQLLAEADEWALNQVSLAATKGKP